jgi:predicted transposase YbfD/YdcC
MITSFLEHFSALEDPRYQEFVIYPLPEILLGALVGVICGAEDWEEIGLFCEEKLEVLQQFLDYKNGVASPKTFWRVFELLDSQAFASCFAAWINSLVGTVEGVVAIDGKTLRGTRQSEGTEKALHVLSAYAHATGLVIGQRCVDGKSNEIKAIPQLLETLAIEGTIVTIDAMGTQKAVVQAIVDRKAEYVLALKGNQSTLHEDVRLFFADATLAAGASVCTTLDSGHGRIEERECRATEDISWLLERHPGWQNLHSVAAVTSTRTEKKSGETTKETRFYLSSLPANAAEILAATRAHWSIENNLHWMLDVLFQEDQCQTRKQNAALNLGVVRKMALGLLKQHPSRLPIKRKIKKASCNNDFLLSAIPKHPR